MANPQKENGYVPIANEIMDALARIRISGEARQVLDAILRKTYGFNKKEDRIALSQLCLATGLKKPTVCKALAKLLKMNLITQKDNGEGNILAFTKDSDLWRPLPKKVTLPKKIMSVTQKGKNHYPKSHIQKTITKDTLTKDNAPDGAVNDFITLFKEVNPSYEQLFPNTTQRSAASRLLKKFGIESMTRTLSIIEKTNGLPYAPVITTPLELERNGGKLKAFLAKNNAPKGKLIV